MLQHLRISHFAHIHALEMELSAGFIAVSGETGAGKSVLLGALNLLAGGKGERSLIQSDAETAEVEALIVFENAKTIDALLEELGIAPCEEGQLLIKRSLHRTRSSRIHVNGNLSTAAALKAISEHWVDFHGPGEHQRIYKQRSQVILLDAYMGEIRVLQDYRTQFNEWQSIARRYEQLAHQEQLSPDELDFLKSQLEKMKAFNLDVSAIHELEADYARAQNAQSFLEGISAIEAAIGDEGGALNSLSDAQRAAQRMSADDAELSALADRLESLHIEADDVMEAFRQYASKLAINDEQIAALEADMSSWMELKRRYGPQPEQVVANFEKLKERLEMQSGVDAKLAALQEEYAMTLDKAKKCDEQLHKKRKVAARALAKAVNERLKDLGFKQAKFEVSFEKASQELSEYGSRMCCFQFQPNPGQPAMPLHKIASMGEAARLMLAIKTVIAEKDKTPLLVFDEVDANVGGEIGREVGKQLAGLADEHQVLCVTHLPQVASLALQHWKVIKHQDDKHTRVELTLLDDRDKRIDELARMLGDRNSSSAKKHAASLI